MTPKVQAMSALNKEATTLADDAVVTAPQQRCRVVACAARFQSSSEIALRPTDCSNPSLVCVCVRVSESGCGCECGCCFVIVHA